MSDRVSVQFDETQPKLESGVVVASDEAHDGIHDLPHQLAIDLPGQASDQRRIGSEFDIRVEQGIRKSGNRRR